MTINFAIQESKNIKSATNRIKKMLDDKNTEIQTNTFKYIGY